MSPEPSAGAPGVGVLAIAALVGAATIGALFAGGASGVDGTLPVGAAAVALLCGALALPAVRHVRFPRLDRAGVALLGSMGLLTLWTGASVVWSIVPDRSWDVFNKNVAFLAFLALGVALAGAAGRFGARVGAWILAVSVAAVLVWALLAKALPDVDPGGDLVARLHEPVGYWNALALVADAGLALALWLGATHRQLLLRVAGTLLAYVSTLALLLTLSRAGIVAGVVAVLLWLVLSRERVEGGLLLAASVVPAAAVAGWAFTRPALVEDAASHSDRVADGAVFGALALVGAGVVIALAFVLSHRVLDPEARRRAARGLLYAVAAAIVAGVIAVVVASGNPATKAWDELTGSSCSEVANQPGRFGSLDLNNRWCWWKEAWEVFAHNAPLGTGAGSFEVARKRYRVNAGSVLEPHSVPLQQLSDGGVPGLALFLLVVASAAGVCVFALRRLADPERSAGVALVALPAAYLVHALVDYDWDFLAVTAPAMLSLGVLSAAGRPVAGFTGGSLLVAGSVLVAASVLASFSFPRLAERSGRAAIRALDERDYTKARDDAERSRWFDPLAVDPLWTLAAVAARQGDGEEALRRYVQAVELQPENPDTWYAIGIYEYQVTGDMCLAYRYLNNAYTLDPAGTEWVKGGALDRARAAVNAGACEK